MAPELTQGCWSGLVRGITFTRPRCPFTEATALIPPPRQGEYSPAFSRRRRIFLRVIGTCPSPRILVSGNTFFRSFMNEEIVSANLLVEVWPGQTSAVNDAAEGTSDCLTAQDQKPTRFGVNPSVHRSWWALPVDSLPALWSLGESHRSDLPSNFTGTENRDVPRLPVKR